MVCERYEGGFGTMRINSTIMINTMNTTIISSNVPQGQPRVCFLKRPVSRSTPSMLLSATSATLLRTWRLCVCVCCVCVCVVCVCVCVCACACACECSKFQRFLSKTCQLFMALNSHSRSSSTNAQWFKPSPTTREQGYDH